MGRTKLIHLADHLGEDLLVELLLAATCPPPQPLRPFFPAPVDDDDPDLALFGDHDATIGRGWGFYTHDREECASRRIDLRTSHDHDPGPIEMTDADEIEIEAYVLDFETSASG